jgi:hypothetical protein
MGDVMRAILRIFFVSLIFTIGGESFADGTWDCEITDYDGTDAELENAGVNPRCPDTNNPWACYCNIEETCEERDSGSTQVFHRQEFMFCGTLAKCNMAWTNTYCR